MQRDIRKSKVLKYQKYVTIQRKELSSSLAGVTTSLLFHQTVVATADCCRHYLNTVYIKILIFVISFCSKKSSSGIQHCHCLYSIEYSYCGFLYLTF